MEVHSSLSSVVSGIDDVIQDTRSPLCSASTPRGNNSFQSHGQRISDQSSDGWAYFRHLGGTFSSPSVQHSISVKTHPQHHRSSQHCVDDRDVFNNPNKSVLIIDSKTSQILTANRIACELFEYEQTELIGSRLSDLLTVKAKNQLALEESIFDPITGDLTQVLGKVMDIMTSTGVIIPVSMFLKRLDGSSISSRSSCNGAVTSSPCTQQSPEAKLRCLVILEAVNRTTGQIIFESTGTILDCDDTIALLHGYTKSTEVMGEKIHSLIPSLVLPRYGFEMTRALSKQSCTAMTRFGTTFPISISITELSTEPLDLSYAYSENHAGDDVNGGCSMVSVYSAIVWIYHSVSGLITVESNGTVRSIDPSISITLLGYNHSQLLVGKDIREIIPSFGEVASCSRKLSMQNDAKEVTNLASPYVATTISQVASSDPPHVIESECQIEPTARPSPTAYFLHNRMVSECVSAYQQPVSDEKTEMCSAQSETTSIKEVLGYPVVIEDSILQETNELIPKVDLVVSLTNKPLLSETELNTNAFGIAVLDQISTDELILEKCDEADKQELYVINQSNISGLDLVKNDRQAWIEAVDAILVKSCIVSSNGAELCCDTENREKLEPSVLDAHNDHDCNDGLVAELCWGKGNLEPLVTDDEGEDAGRIGTQLENHIAQNQLEVLDIDDFKLTAFAHKIADRQEKQEVVGIEGNSEKERFISPGTKFGAEKMTPTFSEISIVGKEILRGSSSAECLITTDFPLATILGPSDLAVMEDLADHESTEQPQDDLCERINSMSLVQAREVNEPVHIDVDLNLFQNNIVVQNDAINVSDSPLSVVEPEIVNTQYNDVNILALEHHAVAYINASDVKEPLILTIGNENRIPEDFDLAQNANRVMALAPVLVSEPEVVRRKYDVAHLDDLDNDTCIDIKVLDLQNGKQHETKREFLGSDYDESTVTFAEIIDQEAGELNSSSVIQADEETVQVSSSSVVAEQELHKKGTSFIAGDTDSLCDKGNRMPVNITGSKIDAAVMSDSLLKVDSLNSSAPGERELEMLEQPDNNQSKFPSVEFNFCTEVAQDGLMPEHNFECNATTKITSVEGVSNAKGDDYNLRYPTKEIKVLFCATNDIRESKSVLNEPCEVSRPCELIDAKDGVYSGFAQHTDGNLLDIRYEVRHVEITDLPTGDMGRDDAQVRVSPRSLYCVWVSSGRRRSVSRRDRLTYADLTLTSSINSSHSVDHDISDCSQHYRESMAVIGSFAADDDDDGDDRQKASDTAEGNDRVLSAWSPSDFSMREKSCLSTSNISHGTSATSPDSSFHCVEGVAGPQPIGMAPNENETSYLEAELSAGSSAYSQRYETLACIGKGAFGCVRLAQRLDDGLQVVVKFIKKKKVLADCLLTLDEGLTVPLEITLLETLNHINIVRLLEYFEGDFFYQAVMEKHGNGIDLFEFIDTCPCIDEPLASHIFQQIVSAVDYLHGLTIVHRDIKDENVIIDEHFHVKLIDFGSAAFFDDHTLFATFCGTMEYCSPEVLLGNRYRGPELEMWSVGVTLYTLVFGESPFTEVSESIEGRFTVPFEISNELSDLLSCLLLPDPLERATISEVVRHAWLQQSPDMSLYRWNEIMNPDRSLSPSSPSADIVSVNRINISSAHSGAVPLSRDIILPELSYKPLNCNGTILHQSPPVSARSKRLYTQ